jgi:hypothetical protein
MICLRINCNKHIIEIGLYEGTPKSDNDKITGFVLIVLTPA